DPRPPPERFRAEWGGDMHERSRQEGPSDSAPKKPRTVLYGRSGGRMFSPRRLTLGGRTYEADADGKVYSVRAGQRRRARDPRILGRIDDQRRAARAAQAVVAGARRAAREAARQAIATAAAVGAIR